MQSMSIQTFTSAVLKSLRSFIFQFKATEKNNVSYNKYCINTYEIFNGFTISPVSGTVSLTT